MQPVLSPHPPASSKSSCLGLVPDPVSPDPDWLLVHHP